MTWIGVRECRVGIEGKHRELLATSPFDFATQARFSLPFLSDPRDPAFSAVAQEDIAALVEAAGGRALVRTTSDRRLGEVARGLVPRWRREGRAVLVQGEAEKSILLERFREHGTRCASPRSGAGRESTCRDAHAGSSCSTACHSTCRPIARTCAVCAPRERLEAQGRLAFRERSLPSATLTLKQGYGRRIRSRSDRNWLRFSTREFGCEDMERCCFLPCCGRCESSRASRRRNFCVRYRADLVATKRWLGTPKQNGASEWHRARRDSS